MSTSLVNISAEVRSAEVRSAEVRSAEVRSAEVRSAEVRSAEVRSTDEVEESVDAHTYLEAAQQPMMFM